MSQRDSDAKLTLLQCKGCEKQYVPPRYFCPACGNTGFAEVNAWTGGKVYSFTMIRMPFEEFADQAPYAFGEVMLDEGLVVPARFTNEKEKRVEIGHKVSFVKRDKGANWFELS